MVKNIILCFLFAALIGCSIWETCFLVNKVERYEVLTQEIHELIKKNKEAIDTEENIRKASELLEMWNKDKHLMQLFISHIYINDFSMKIVSLKTHVEQNEYGLADTDCALIIENCELLKEQHTPYPQSIL